MEKTTGILGTIKQGFTNLTKREQVLIYILAVVVVLAILIFLIILPAMTHISELTDEVATYKSEEMDKRLTIAQADAYEAQYKASSKNLRELKRQFYVPMDPESLDETITALIIQSGLRPKDLQMTTLQQGNIPPYTLKPLAIPDTPATTDGAAEDLSTESTENTSEGAQDGTEAYVYAVAAKAEGDKSQLSRLVDIVNATAGIKLHSYKYSLTGETMDLNAIIMGGEVELSFYVYVYVDNTSGIAYSAIGSEQDN